MVAIAQQMASLSTDDQQRRFARSVGVASRRVSYLSHQGGVAAPDRMIWTFQRTKIWIMSDSQKRRMLFEQRNVSGPGRIEIPWAPWPLLNQWLQFFANRSGSVVPPGLKAYQVRVRFGRSDDSNPPIHGPFDWDGAANGDSYLTRPKPESDFAVRVDGIQCTIRFNKQNRVACLEVESCQADSIDTVLTFARKCANSLSFTMGMATNTPVYYDAVLARSADGMQVFLDAHAPVPNSNIGDGDSIWLSRPLKALASMFLEGIRSNSPFYRFFCFFNVAYRINNVTKNRLRELCASNLLGRPQLNGALTADRVIDVVAPQLVGTKYTDLISRYQSEYRNAIAHFDPKDRLVPFDLDAESKIRTASIVMSVVSRDLLDQVAAAVRDLASASVNLADVDLDGGREQDG